MQDQHRTSLEASFTSSQAPLLHVYEREVQGQQRDSLSVLAQQVPEHARVLDRGCGSGALGRYMRQRGPIYLDGVTYNPQEAQRAQEAYDRVVVADLEHPDWVQHFADERYDRIVCADVLEHLRNPEKVLHACLNLLHDNGELLISVPNAAYAGLVAELLHGQFTYRDEGLLDRTHLRFFTRQSLAAFLQEHHWHVQVIDTVERSLDQSEFKLHFDTLPPAVAQYLLTAPDAQTYQFIVTARPMRPASAQDLPAQTASEKTAPALTATVPLPAHAWFSAHVYWAQAQQPYQENHKILTRGVVGQLYQTLRFPLPAHEAFDRLRFDPADRPGFLRLRSLRLLDAQGAVCWQWPAQGTLQAQNQLTLRHCPQQGLTVETPWWSEHELLILLHSDDPWIELPVQLQASEWERLRAGVLEVDMGWPMSADYLALSQVVQDFVLEKQVQQDQMQILNSTNLLLQDKNQVQQEQLQQLQQSQAQQLREQQRQEQTLQQLQKHTQTLQEQQDILCTQQQALMTEKNSILRHQRHLSAALYHANRDRENLQKHLQWIENSTVFRATRPLVRFKAWITGHHPPAAPTPTALHMTALTQAVPDWAHPDAPVDIIVPVYKGLEDTQRCVNSVLQHPQKTAWQLIIINDASPEPELTQWLRELATQHPAQVQLLENEHNLGFVGTVNRGMALHPERDVLLLNSDTEVANNWLDKITRAAYGHGRVGSVTPFSNNATICSYPKFCKGNELPMGWDTAALDQIFAQAAPGQVVDVPTGVGFCMYIRRECLNEVGLFDVERFGKGYGEENDFCRRAHAAGWRNLHALDTFVLHTGGVSFGDSKNAREMAAVDILRQLYPDYDRAVHHFVQADPARPIRLLVDLLRVQAHPSRVVLAVSHNREGGTLRHVYELAQHLKEQATFFLLRPCPGQCVELTLADPSEAFALYFKIPEQLPELLQTLQDIGVQHIHYHHLLGHCVEIAQLAEMLGVSSDFTAHDYYSYCPQISLTGQDNRYCGEQGLEQCHQCLKKTPAPEGQSIEHWRQHHLHFLRQQRHVLAPSLDTARRMATFADGADVRVVAHTDTFSHPPQHPLLPAWDAAQTQRPLKVAVLGALSTIKGADVLEDLALLAKRQKTPVEFHLLGFGYRDLQTRPRSYLSVHGRFEEKDLPELLQWLQPDVVWFPALWPETYSYTLSAALHAALPIVAPDLGAFAQRLQERPWSWVQPWDQTPAQWLAFFTDIRSRHFLPGHPPEPPACMPKQAVDVRFLPWEYQQDYLAHLPTPATLRIPDLSRLITHQVMAREGLDAWQHATRSTTLNVLQTLRSAPGLRTLVRMIPSHWQRRVKSWLVR